MASIDIKVLTEILNSGTLSNALQMDLKDHHFKDPEVKQIYRYIRQHYEAVETRSSLPLLDDIKTKWPGFDLVHLNRTESGNIKTLIRHLKMSSLGIDFHSALRLLQDMAEEEEASPETLVKMANESFRRLSQDYAQGSRPLGISDIKQHMEDSYEGALTGTAYGIPWPWKCLTDDTLGKKPEDFIVFYGRMKSMKTWLILYSAAMDYLEHNQKVMIWSREMSAKMLQLRMASILSKVDYQLLKSGNLPPKVWGRAVKVMAELELMYQRHEGATPGDEANKARRDIFLLCGRDAPKTIEDLMAKVDEYKPDILYVDSFYHLSSERASRAKQDHLHIQYLAEDIKQMAIDMAIPVVAAAQANRGGEKGMGRDLTEVAGSDAIGREADLMIRVIYTKGSTISEEEYEDDANMESAKPKRSILKGPKKKRTTKKDPHPRKIPDRMSAHLGLILPGNREGVLEGFTLKVIPGYCFDVRNEEFSSESIREWINKDNAEAVKEAEKGAAKRRRAPKEDPPMFSTNSIPS